MTNLVETGNCMEGDSSGNRKKRTAVPIWRKELLTLEEAAEYTGLGLQKLRDLSNEDDCDFVLWNHTKRMFKRRRLEQYIETLYSI